MNKKLLKIARLIAITSGCNHNKLRGFMLDHVINNGVKIHFISDGTSLEIKYLGCEFNINDLIISEKVFGGGTETIIKFNTDGKLDNRYVNGYNIYTLDCKTIAMSEEYNIQGPIDTEGGRCTVYIATKLFGKQFWDSEYYDVIEEIISNIANYVNIRPQKINVLCFLWGIVKYGIQNRGNRYSSFG